VTADEHGRAAEVSSRHLQKITISRPGDISISVHRTEGFDREFLRQELIRIFNKTDEAANVILQTIEIVGAADCGTYSRQIAETKVDEVRLDALRRHTRIDMRLSVKDVSINKAN
jgi:ATP-dependent Clp protease adapter protein ClpS